MVVPASVLNPKMKTMSPDPFDFALTPLILLTKILMARVSGVEIFSLGEVAIVHRINRTVRRCYLLGDDPVTGKNFDHHKACMEIELQKLARFMGIDLLGVNRYTAYSSTTRMPPTPCSPLTLCQWKHD
jgi:hypothetical protein